MDDEQISVGKFWDEHRKNEKTAVAKKVHWWDSLLVWREAQKAAFGDEMLNGNEFLGKLSNGKPFERAISIGAGAGNKEIDLILKGIVKNFVCFELGKESVQAGEKLARDHGISDQVKFIQADGMREGSALGGFDLVYWNNALHHMTDIKAAIQLSHQMLKRGGVFYMDDYVGPNRLQWRPEAIKIVSSILKNLPEKYLRKVNAPHELVNTDVSFPTAEQVAADDPTEAVNSEAILTHVKEFFPGVKIFMMGGAIFQVAFQNIIGNFDETDETDRALIKMICMIDQLATQLPEIGPNYAVAYGQKN